MRFMPDPLCPLRHFHVADLKHGNHSFDSSNRRMRCLEVMKPEEQYKILNKIPNKIPKKIPKKIHFLCPQLPQEFRPELSNM